MEWIWTVFPPKLAMPNFLRYSFFYIVTIAPRTPDVLRCTLRVLEAQFLVQNQIALKIIILTPSVKYLARRVLG